MGIGKLIMTALSVVILMFIVVTSIEIIVPISKNQDFDELCRSYALLMEKKGGLSIQEKSELSVKIAGLGLSDIIVEAPNYGQTRFGEIMNLQVKANCLIKLGASGLRLHRMLQPFTYQRSMFCREIELE